LGNLNVAKEWKTDMIKNLLNATKIGTYSPDGAFNLMCILDKCTSNSDNSTLWSRLKVFLPYLPSNLSVFPATDG
jgi:hypothetical protein